MSSDFSSYLSWTLLQGCAASAGLFPFASHPTSSFHPPTPTSSFFTACKLQTSRACSWVWLKSAEYLQGLSEEEPLGHCHGNFDNPDNMQMWLFRAIWECLPLSSLSIAWGKWGLLAYSSFFFCIFVQIKLKRVHKISVIKILCQISFIKNFIWS